MANAYTTADQANVATVLEWMLIQYPDLPLCCNWRVEGHWQLGMSLSGQLAEVDDDRKALDELDSWVQFLKDGHWEGSEHETYVYIAAVGSYRGTPVVVWTHLHPASYQR